MPENAVSIANDGTPESRKANRGPHVFAESLFAEVEARRPPSGWAKPASEFAGTLSASTAGTVFWAMTAESKLGLPARLLGTAALSGTTRVAVQGGMERLLLPAPQRSSLSENFAWGVVDGYAGVLGTAAEAAVGRRAIPKIGAFYLGDCSPKMAEIAGKKAIENSLSAKLGYNMTRGMTGGAVGAFAWSVPHELYNDRDKLGTEQGRWNVCGKIVNNTLFGAATGGILSGTVTGVANYRDLQGYTRAWLKPNAEVTRFDLLHFNDLHSSLVGENGSFPQVATKIRELREGSRLRGVTSALADVGDNHSGNAVSGFTRTGYVETKAINMMHPDVILPGNHVTDSANGGLDIDGWVNNINQISKELGRELPAVGANIELAKYPNFIGPTGSVYKPYRVLEVATSGGGKERIGVIGLTTKELADLSDNGQIKYLNAQEQAERWIRHLNKPVSEGGEGINKVVIASHLGPSVDEQLAKNVKGISYIMNSHSHEAEPVIRWVKNAETGWDVPMMQGGSYGQWLVESNVALKPNGAADKYRTFARLHRIDSSVPADPEIKAFVDAQLPELKLLDAQKFSAEVTGPFRLDGMRGQELRQTELGTVIARSLLEGTNDSLPLLNAERASQGLKPIPSLSIMLEHTGGIRAGMEPGIQTRRTLSDVFINSGGEGEWRELTAASLKGSEIERALNYGVADIPTTAQTTPTGGTQQRWLRSFKDAFRDSPPEINHDYSGNFIQTEGLKYSIDLSKPVGQRISNVRVIDSANHKYVPLDPNNTYEVLCRTHAVEKWSRNGVFGEAVKSGGRDAVHVHADLKPVPLSQVDLLGKHLNNRSTLSPADYLSENIKNLTPSYMNSRARPRIATLGSLSIRSYLEEPLSSSEQ